MKAVTKSVQHGKTKYSTVACVSKANGKNDAESYDELE
jgi:hypothetical protein